MSETASRSAVTGFSIASFGGGGSLFVMKETSVDPVFCFRGVYTGAETGVLAYTTHKGSVRGLVKNNGNLIFGIEGAITSNQIAATGGGANLNALFSGIQERQQASGTWRYGTPAMEGSWSSTLAY